MRQWALIIAIAFAFVPCVAAPYYCSDPHRGGDWLQGSITLRVTPNGRLQSHETGEWSEWDWKMVPAYFQEAAAMEPKPIVKLPIHNPDVTFDQVAPIIHQAQSAKLPHLWLEAMPSPGSVGAHSVTFLNRVTCGLKLNEDVSARAVITLTVAQDGAITWNGERINQTALTERISDQNGPLIHVVPAANARFFNVVQTMWWIAQHGAEWMVMDGEE